MLFPRDESESFPQPRGSIEFQIVDWYIPDSDKNTVETTPNDYLIYMFGTTDTGTTVCTKITGFMPYFFVKPPESWLNSPEEHAKELENKLKYETVDKTWYNKSKKQQESYKGTVIPKKFHDHRNYLKIVRRKEFMGFTNDTLYPYLKIQVTTMALFNILKKYFMASKTFKICESNLDPYLRFIHEKNIQPCGWVKLPAGKYMIDNTNFTRTKWNVEIFYKDIVSLNYNKIAPLLIASFDIECTSSHGDFPVAKKDYKKLACDLIAASSTVKVTRELLKQWITDLVKANSQDIKVSQYAILHKLYFKSKKPVLPELTDDFLDKVINCLDSDSSNSNADSEEKDIEETETCVDPKQLTKILTAALPELQGDPIIQIGTTVNRYGSDEIVYKHIVTLGSCSDIENVDVETYDSEKDLLLAWKEFITRLDPDILIGYNIFGFDMKYMYERAIETGAIDNFSVGLGRIINRKTSLDIKRLSSSALGDNLMYIIDLDGIVCIDQLKVTQRDEKLDSYKLDAVASTFLKENKCDLKPHEIFSKFKGDADDRAEIAKYCIQDCVLVNRLLHNRKVLENNIGMGNVCYVPLKFLFMRGQGIKIFSLVAKECREKNFVIPVLSVREDGDTEEESGYEGAIVLEPETGMYLDDPIVVLDYNSLYPSSMISRNISHDCYVMDPKYLNIEGIQYLPVEYEVHNSKKEVIGKQTCMFAQLPDGKKGVIPSILMMLLDARKTTRKKIEYKTINNTYIGLVIEDTEEQITIQDIDTKTKTTIKKSDIFSMTDTFTDTEKAILDARQLAYKITANSLYGQCGSRTSPIYLKEIAAATTATGREMISIAKDFVTTRYNARVIYGDTDSIFCKFPVCDEQGNILKGKQALPGAIKAGQKAAKEIKAVLPEYQTLAYEKTMYPFILFSKKRYVGNLYEDDPDSKPKQKSMGIALKRRDYAPIVKKIYGGIINILLNSQDLQMSTEFLKEQLQNLIDGKYPIEDLIVSKTLKAEYKDPSKIAHCVLADRIGERDNGNRPMVNERIPYVYINAPNAELQGDRIEHPDYIKEHNLVPDYQFYIVHQLMKPICQLYALCVETLPDYNYPPGYWMQMDIEMETHKLYCDETKRKNRIQNLMEKEVEDILFSPFLQPVLKKRKVAAEKPKKSDNKKKEDPLVEKQTLHCSVKRDKNYIITRDTLTNAELPYKKTVNKRKSEFLAIYDVLSECMTKNRKTVGTFVFTIDNDNFKYLHSCALKLMDTDLSPARETALKNQDIGKRDEIETILSLQALITKYKDMYSIS